MYAYIHIHICIYIYTYINICIIIYIYTHDILIMCTVYLVLHNMANSMGNLSIPPSIGAGGSSHHLVTGQGQGRSADLEKHIREVYSTYGMYMYVSSLRFLSNIGMYHCIIYKISTTSCH